MQILFADDPQLQSKFTQIELRMLNKQIFQQNLDSGANRTYIIAMLPGGKETFESVRLLFDSVNFRDLFQQCTDYHGEVTAPNDGKMQNLMLGVGQHSSTFPSVYNLSSQNRLRSEPQIIRTAATVAADNRRRIEEKGQPADHNSVEAEPIDFLMSHPIKDLSVVLPIAPLHGCILIANHFVKYLVKLDITVAIAWITRLRVKPNPRRGKDGLSGFLGNHCRIILKSTSQLRRLVPSLEKLSKYPNSSKI